MSGGTAAGEVAEVAVAEGELPRTTLRITVGEDVGRFWRALEGVYAGLGRSESFVAFLVRAVANSWRGTLAEVAYGDVYRRDRWRCASPVCTRRHVTPHHIRFRSRGGGDEPGNVIALCEVCHLELVHGGRLVVAGTAPADLRWEALGWSA